MRITIQSESDVNGNPREFSCNPTMLGGVVIVTPEEYRRLAVITETPLDDEDARIVDGE